MFLYVKCVMSYTTEFSVKGLFKLELLLVKTKAKAIYKINEIKSTLTEMK